LTLPWQKHYHALKTCLKEETSNLAEEENSMSNLAAIRESIYSGNSRESMKFTKMELGEGTPWGEILQKAMLPAMNQVGEEFSKGIAFLPELIAAGNAMTKSIEVIKANIPSVGLGDKGVFVIGTVLGDVHDIGKNIVKICLEGAGFRVVDLGTDVAPEAFAQACRENKAHLVGISALLSSTMLNIEQAVKAIRGENPEVKVMVGGAPLTEEIARKMGADGFAPDAYLASKKAEELLQEKRLNS
jgi:5-methyltetrahydrofolate--homocysteine methyltransferase